MARMLGRRTRTRESPRAGLTSARPSARPRRSWRQRPRRSSWCLVYVPEEKKPAMKALAAPTAQALRGPTPDRSTQLALRGPTPDKAPARPTRTPQLPPKPAAAASTKRQAPKPAAKGKAKAKVKAAALAPASRQLLSQLSAEQMRATWLELQSKFGQEDGSDDELAGLE